MPSYRLSPKVDRIDWPEWAASTYNGECHVSADDERDARLLAVQAFGIAVQPVGYGGVGRVCGGNQHRRSDSTRYGDDARPSRPLPAH